MRLCREGYNRRVIAGHEKSPGRIFFVIDLSSPLSLRNAICFPVQSPAARRETAIGALWLLVPMVGWLMNMGHRIVMVHKMQQGLSPWPSWDRRGQLLRHGFFTWLGMIYYYAPAGALALLGAIVHSRAAYAGAAVLFTAASIAIPGYMSHYCRAYDPREIFNPVRALRRVGQGGAGYWKAWSIALAALALSFAGLLGLGVAFLFTSVWFWQTAGYAFANTFTRVHALAALPRPVADDRSAAVE